MTLYSETFLKYVMPPILAGFSHLTILQYRWFIFFTLSVLSGTVCRWSKWRRESFLICVGISLFHFAHSVIRWIGTTRYLIKSKKMVVYHQTNIWIKQWD